MKRIERFTTEHPAITFHFVLNFAGYLNYASKGVEETPVAWLLLSPLRFPVALFGIYLLRDSTRRSTVPEAA